MDSLRVCQCWDSSARLVVSWLSGVDDPSSGVSVYKIHSDRLLRSFFSSKENGSSSENVTLSECVGHQVCAKDDILNDC